MIFLLQWVPQDVLSAPISCATYSCNSQLVYASFADGNIGVFDADNLRLRCRIAPSAYLSQASSNRYYYTSKCLCLCKMCVCERKKKSAVGDGTIHSLKSILVFIPNGFFFFGFFVFFCFYFFTL